MKKYSMKFLGILICIFLIIGCSLQEATEITVDTEIIAEEQKESSEVTEVEETGSDSLKEKIVIGQTSGSSGVSVFEKAIPILEAQGYEVEVEMFNDFNTPNTAVADGSLDYNFYQHVAFLRNFNESYGTSLVAVDETGVYATQYGVYSNKLNSLDEIEDGMRVSIQNDNSNMNTSLRLLESEGLIKIADGVETASVIDIVDNKYNLEFVEMEETMIIGTLDDVDFGCVSTSRWVEAGNDASEVLAAVVGKDSQQVVVTRPELKDSKTAKDIYAALASDEVQKFVKEKFQGGLVPIKDVEE